jgi:hypothetical protein
MTGWIPDTPRRERARIAASYDPPIAAGEALFLQLKRHCSTDTRACGALVTFSCVRHRGRVPSATAADLVRRRAGRSRLPDALRRADTLARTGPPAVSIGSRQSD